jgi:small-conductance mechanosensitive channel
MLLAFITMEELTQYTFLNNDAKAWIISGIVFVALMFVLGIVRRFITSRGKKLLESKKAVLQLLGAMMSKVLWFTILFLSIGAAAQALTLSDFASRAVQVIVIAFIALQFVVWAISAFEKGLDIFVHKRQAALGQPDAGLLTALPTAKFIGRLLIGVIVILLALQNMGVDVTAMVAGLGIGGIAVALALQNVLGDLFGSLSIVLDKPFVVGDYIVVGQHQGTVEKIGLKTSHVRALSGEQLVFTNSDLLASRIQNFKRMQERRAMFAIGVTYATTMDQAKQVADILGEIVQSQPGVRFERAHFKTFGAFALDFEVVYWMLDPDFKKYMDTQQAINIEIGRRLKAIGVEFAFPTQTVFLEDGAGRLKRA